MYNCSLCDRLNLRKKRSVCALWLSVHMKAVVEQGFFNKFIFDNKALKTFVKFWIWWKRLKFQRCQIRTSSHLYKVSTEKEVASNVTCIVGFRYIVQLADGSKAQCCLWQCSTGSNNLQSKNHWH